MNNSFANSWLRKNAPCYYEPRPKLCTDTIVRYITSRVRSRNMISTLISRLDCPPAVSSLPPSMCLRGPREMTMCFFAYLISWSSARKTETVI